MQVDLQQVAVITDVQLWTRWGCCNNRLSQVSVYVTNTSLSGMQSNTLNQLQMSSFLGVEAACYVTSSTSVAVTSFQGPCSGVGRYITLQRVNTADGDVTMNLCALQVYGQ
jgi:hypothetical protein